MTDILNYLLALSAIFFGYRIYISRRKGKSFREIRPLTLSFVICVLLLWGITVFMGNHRIHRIFQLKSQRHEKDKNRIHAVRIALLAVRIRTRD